MGDYSAVAPPQNFNQSTAFAAALQRAKQIAAKINPAGGSAGPSESGRQKRPLDEGGPEPEPKKLASLDFGNSSMAPPGSGDVGPSRSSGAARGQAGLGGGVSSGGPALVNEEISVPDKMVGLLIGRGGEQITRLQTKTGCKIQMAVDSNGQPERMCSLLGPQAAVQMAKDMIFSIIEMHQRGGRHDPPQQHSAGNSPVMGGSGGSGGSGNSQGGGGGGGGSQGGGSQGGGGMTHVEIMVPGPKVGLIIGKGGETIKQLQGKSGAKMVVIQDGPNPEAEKPLRISGNPQEVEYAKQLVYELIAEKEMQSSNRGMRGGGGGGGGGGRNQDRGNGGGGGGMMGGGGYDDDYGHGGGGMGGGGGGGGGNGGDGVEVQVPRAAVGVVIGKGGEMIKKIQSETGARVQFQQGRDDGPGDRRCFLSGKPQNVDAARQRIEELIDSVIRRDNEGGSGGGMGGGGGGGGGRNRRNNDFGGGNQRNGGGPQGGGGGGYGGGNGGGPQGGWNGGGNGGGNGGPHQIEVSFQVPTYKCGVIIGRGGETIKQINQQSGAHCELDRRANGGNGQEKTFVIRGDPECVENAKRIIGDKVQLPLFFTATSPAPSAPAAVPTAYPGVAAPQGYTPQQWGGAAQEYQQQWNQTQQSAPVNTQVQINPQTGQPDYSKQWAEYYRSLGMHREADMIEQQSKAGGGQPGAPGAAPGPMLGQQPAPQPVTTAPMQAQSAPSAANGGGGAGQPDYSAQWAEYYRSIGKMKEAEAIEAQMKNKVPGPQVGQPGGAVPSANPALGGQPAVAGAPAAPGTTPAGGAPQAFPAYGAYGGYYAQQPASAQNPAQQPQYNFAGYGNYGQQSNSSDN